MLEKKLQSKNGDDYNDLRLKEAKKARQLLHMNLGSITSLNDLTP